MKIPSWAWRSAAIASTAACLALLNGCGSSDASPLSSAPVLTTPTTSAPIANVTAVLV
jgi:hypothetical protein